MINLKQEVKIDQNHQKSCLEPDVNMGPGNQINQVKNKETKNKITSFTLRFFPNFFQQIQTSGMFIGFRH